MATDIPDKTSSSAAGDQQDEVTAIQLREVNFSYNGSPVLEDVNFEVGQRQLVYMVGPNGGGKTTLLKLIMGLLQPVKGQVRVFGQSPEKARSRIGYAPQYLQFDPRFPVTVMDIVLMGRLGAKFGGRYSASDRDAAMEALEVLEVSDLARRSFSELSGGLRQRVLIARSLSDDPDLLLLDEPTANVDSHTEDKLLDIIRQLSDHMTILMVSHDLGFVAGSVKNVICVNRQVMVHPTGDITGDAVRQLFDREMRIIRHDIKH
jgi:zinc transport system ATP-binding protein